MGTFQECTPSFAAGIVVVEEFLPPKDLSQLRDAAMCLVLAKRVHIPLHKRGATISHHDLMVSAPAIPAFYHSHELRRWRSSIIGESV